MSVYFPSNFNLQELDWYKKIVEKLLKLFEKGPREVESLNYDKVVHYILQEEIKGQKFSFPAKWKLNFVFLRYYPQLVDTPKGRLLQRFLRKTKTRSLSGIVPLSVFTRGRGCPFHCVYCPTAGGEDIPKSYFPDEAAVQRALRFQFDPYKQVLGRLIMFYLSGHKIDKVELIIQGGTFSFYEKEYREWFVKRCFEAANNDVGELIKKGHLPLQREVGLKEAQRINEATPSRIVGITVETRPDYITEEELNFLRKLGVTRVEMGVQIVDDRILRLVKRGHTTEEVKKATYLLKEHGFKVTYHLMLNLPGSNPDHDLEMLKEVFKNPDYRPDNIKVYPTALVRGSELLKWYKEGKYRPYSQEKLVSLLVNFKEQVVPEYVRIQRLVRDLTKNDQLKVLVESHLRQKLHQARVKCNCIRCREIKDKTQSQIYLKIFAYQASQGIEYFLSFVDKNNRLYGLLRLRVLHKLQGWQAIIRELHVYGQAVGIGEKSEMTVQHKGLGRKLIKKAEEIAKWHRVDRLAVISGVGVREYYRRLGFRLEKTYMVKNLSYN